MDGQRLAALFNSSPDAILVVAPSGEILRANDRVRDVLGWDPDTLEGESVELLVPDTVSDHASLRDSFFENPETRPMGAGLDLRAKREDASTIPVDISLSPIEDDGDGPPDVLAAVRDVTEQETLRRKYRTLLETAPDAAFVVGVDSGEILEANAAAAELLGADESAVVGRDAVTLVPESDRERYAGLLSLGRGERVRHSRFENGDDIEVTTADGRRVPVAVSAQRVDAAGEDVVLTMLRDVSERREYEASLNRQIDRLERLAQVLSHDLRNPLNVAEGNLEMARETEDFDRLDEVAGAHERMREIIDEALTMVRSGNDVETVDPVSVAEFARECWANVSTGEATLDVDSPGIVYADEGRLAHLFENLFRNAIEHAGDGATVRVGVVEDSFYVADDGPGIPEGEREAVFELGWTTADAGSGLGLNIVADIAAAHGWTVAVGESVDGGARFDFEQVHTAPFDDAFVSELGDDDGPG
jgi:PAS domain S-box-containing protein